MSSFALFPALFLGGLLAAVSPLGVPEASAAEPLARTLVPELEALTKDRLFRQAQVAVQVVHVDSGEEVFAHNADQALSPASTMKILTAAAALKTLGPAYRFTTDLLTDGSVEPSGALRGDLYVRGHGDPTLVVEKLWKLVYDLQLAGVDRIDGDLVFDETFLDTDYLLPGWDKKEDLERGPSYFPSVSALSLNFNTVALVVTPAVEVGRPAEVSLETPAGGYVTIESDVKTGASGSWRSLEIEREVEEGSMVFRVSGTVPHGSEPTKHYRTVADPTAHFAAAFADMLERHGVAVGGKTRRATTPEGARALVSLPSPPLAAILMDMNKFSNNFIAELVLRAMGAEERGLPGTTEKGTSVVEEYLTSLGLDASTFTLINGSGLTRKGFLTPAHLTAVLLDMARDRQVGHEFATSLAIGGLDGTLWRRFRSEAGRLRGKTGTIDGIHCLAGYVEGGDGEEYAFAFLVNDTPSISRVKALHDELAERIFSLAPDEGEVVDSEVAEP